MTLTLQIRYIVYHTMKVMKVFKYYTNAFHKSSFDVKLNYGEFPKLPMQTSHVMRQHCRLEYHLKGFYQNYAILHHSDSVHLAVGWFSNILRNSVISERLTFFINMVVV